MVHSRQMNDLMRDKFTDEKGNIPLFAEILAGGTVSPFPVAAVAVPGSMIFWENLGNSV